jgi:hypothetical protein
MKYLMIIIPCKLPCTNAPVMVMVDHGGEGAAMALNLEQT